MCVFADISLGRLSEVSRSKIDELKVQQIGGWYSGSGCSAAG